MIKRRSSITSQTIDERVGIAGVEVSWKLYLHWTGLRSLVIALAVIGSGLDVVSVPLLVSAGFCSPMGEELDATDSEGERDQAPDDLNDLTWSLVQIASRAEKRRHPQHPPEFLPVSKRGSQGMANLQTTPRPTALPTSIRLCRFMC